MPGKISLPKNEYNCVSFKCLQTNKNKNIFTKKINKIKMKVKVKVKEKYCACHHNAIT